MTATGRRPFGTGGARGHHNPGRRQPPGAGPPQELAPEGPYPTQADARPAPGADRAPPAFLVEGHVPDRGGLLLDAGLPARHRRSRGRGPVAHRHPHLGAADAVRRPADLPAGRPREPARRGLDRHAGAAAVVVAGQALRAGPARLRGHRISSSPSPCRPPTPPPMSWRTRWSPSSWTGTRSPSPCC